MNYSTIKMRMSDGSEKNCVIIAEFTNEDNNKTFAFYTFEEQLEGDECEIHTVLKIKNETGFVYEKITDQDDLNFAKEMFNNLTNLAKGENENGTK